VSGKVPLTCNCVGSVDPGRVQNPLKAQHSFNVLSKSPDSEHLSASPAPRQPKREDHCPQFQVRVLCQKVEETLRFVDGGIVSIVAIVILSPRRPSVIG